MDVIIKIDHIKKSKEIKELDNKLEYDSSIEPTVFLNELHEAIKEKIKKNNSASLAQRGVDINGNSVE